MDKEIWKDIESYEGLYQVSNLGKVKSLERYVNWRNTKKLCKSFILKPYDNSFGYLIVKLCKEGKMRNYRVNRLVAKAFIPNPNNRPEVNHLDGCKYNNCVENLEWCFPKENVAHAYKNNLVKKPIGSECSFAQLTELQVKQIRTLYDTGNYTISDLATHFNVSYSIVWKAIKHVTYKNIH